ncbi:hypothetical protein DJ83_05385 [Halorubrum ezzemoulense]|uniref:TFIIB-type zinc ribbon-containing protein n=1 Tax=Halorubrum ezzemoulense TaxID=337243 RepID=A0A256KT05_HALEZ|nr:MULTISPECIES: hypothetical protein [Halorubrum]OYR62430.1 hypothetical protein DJ83_05385 [Halorubrum ezzemoulense]OYR83843.1 hypothetical protein DJ84_07105 [Halorubrum ezzemoulense]PHQ44149.1 hypothetical protein Z052_00365 [Halorubrum sp. C191]QAY20129.1 hypothetical protein EO776_08950 [Halorubrum ezzemoulense]
MKVRGERECQSCGTRWSYYETGSVACPSCGDLRSVGVDARTAHTDAPVALDLAAHRERFGNATGTLPRSGVDELQSDLREYCRKRGFIDGGRLVPLDETYLAARELLEAVDCFERLRDATDADREYLLGLLAGADDGERPAAGEVPTALREARGMAAVRAVEAYRSDALDFLDELESGAGPDGAERTADAEGDSPAVTVEGESPGSRIGPARDAFERLRDRVARADALGGDVPPAAADGLVKAADALGTYVRTGDETTLTTANRLIDDASVDDFDPADR